MKTTAFTKYHIANGAKMAELCDECIAVPAKVTARAQEMHILIGHILCELVDGE